MEKYSQFICDELKNIYDKIIKLVKIIFNEKEEQNNACKIILAILKYIYKVY